mmetsp:Transcript_25332/g.39961  ORF Transcript_25332/g.39961 Transcript_25332/m.39961 type:complete len:353 (+) Transcript_25332:1268-2326(+)
MATITKPVSRKHLHVPKCFKITAMLSEDFMPLNGEVPVRDSELRIHNLHALLHGQRQTKMFRQEAHTIVHVVTEPVTCILVVEVSVVHHIKVGGPIDHLTLASGRVNHGTHGIKEALTLILEVSTQLTSHILHLCIAAQLSSNIAILIFFSEEQRMLASSEELELGDNRALELVLLTIVALNDPLIGVALLRIHDSEVRLTGRFDKLAQYPGHVLVNLNIWEYAKAVIPVVGLEGEAVRLRPQVESKSLRLIKPRSYSGEAIIIGRIKRNRGALPEQLVQIGPVQHALLVCPEEASFAIKVNTINKTIQVRDEDSGLSIRRHSVQINIYKLMAIIVGDVRNRAIHLNVLGLS